MINFSAISNKSVMGRLMRYPLSLLPRGKEVRILQGPLRGKRWIVDSGNHGFWLGTYELQKIRRVVQLVKPGNTCFDIGANVGYYTLLLSKLVGIHGRVFAFEPLPANLNYLRQHVLINKCYNTCVFDSAVSDMDGIASFVGTGNRCMGHLSPSGDQIVNCVSLDRFVSDERCPAPSLMKIDVEGAEPAVLKGAHKILREAKPIVLLATHGPEVHRACCSLLKECGYGLEALDAYTIDSASEVLAVAQ